MGVLDYYFFEPRYQKVIIHLDDKSSQVRKNVDKELYEHL
jgi:hypothetical protein